MTTPTLVRVVCACGHVAQHHCHVSWDTDSALTPGTKWRSNGTHGTCWVWAVADDWVVYSPGPVGPQDGRAMRRMDFLGRFTCLGPATAEDHHQETT